MSIIKSFWRSFNNTDDTLDEHFSSFAEAYGLIEEEADEIRTDIVKTLIEYFAKMVDEIHEAEQQDSNSTGLSPVGKIFDYFADVCLQLEEDTKELVRKSISASADEFDAKDDDDYERKVLKFLKALVHTTPSPDKDYIDWVDDPDEIAPDPYGNRYADGVKVFNRAKYRYGHGPNEGTDVLINPTFKSQDLLGRTPDNSLKGDTAATKTLHPNSMPGHSIGLSIAHHALPGFTQYCVANDIARIHLGMGPGVQHFAFENEADRGKASRYLKQMFGQTSFKPFTRKTNEGAALQGASPLEESITHGIDKYGQATNHDQLVAEALKFMRKSGGPSSYSDGAMIAVREQLHAHSKMNAENPLFDNDTSRDPALLAKLRK